MSTSASSNSPAPESPQNNPSPPSTPASLYEVGFKFGENDPVPAHLRGKGVKDLIEHTQRLEAALAQASWQTPPQTSSQPQYQAPQPQLQPQATPVAPPDYSLAYSEPERFAREYDAYNQRVLDARLNQYAAPILNSNAQNARALSRSDPSLKDAWDFYAHEIDALMMNVAPQFKLSKDIWDQAARLALSNHIDEVAQRRAESLAANRPMTERSQYDAPNSPGTSFNGDEIDALWTEDLDYIKWARNAGTSKNDMREAARKMGYSMKEYADMIRKSNALRSHRNILQTQDGQTQPMVTH